MICVYEVTMRVNATKEIDNDHYVYIFSTESYSILKRISETFISSLLFPWSFALLLLNLLTLSSYYYRFIRLTSSKLILLRESTSIYFTVIYKKWNGIEKKGDVYTNES